MTEKNTFKMETHPADFTILVSALFTIARQMGINMERTARSPVYFSAHDFVTAIITKEMEMLALAEYIPVLVGSTPFAVQAVNKYFGEEVYEGDVFLVNDPYFLDGGNHMADWCIVYPIFWNEKQILWVANKAHQQDTGGGAPGGYNPHAMDVYGEGLRIPPVKIFEKGKERKDVLNLIMMNVRIPETQRGDLLALIGAARIAERRLKAVYDSYGEDKMNRFITDFMNYGEFMMREEIKKLPEGLYRSEIRGKEGASPIVCDLTVSGSDITIDLSGSGPIVERYINSPISNTYSSVYMALLTSIGKKIKHHCGGTYRPVKILTEPGKITHAVHPATHGNCTLSISREIIESVWAALAQAAPHETPAGWGSANFFAFSGIDPRRGEGFGSPDFLADSCGAGAIWGTDGWSGNGPVICSGTLYKPEIEICEMLYPLVWEKFEFAENSGAPGKYRGGLGVENQWRVESGTEPVYVAYGGDTMEYEVAPSIDGGKLPPTNSKKIIMANGKEEDFDDIRKKMMYRLQQGDKVMDYTGGGAGVGSPLERDVEAVQEDVRNGVVSLESAQNDYGVVISPETFEINALATKDLREELSAKQ
jgi:N-methylhydantoinase B